MYAITLPNLDWSWEAGDPPSPLIQTWQAHVRHLTRTWFRAGASTTEWMDAYSQLHARLTSEVWKHTIPERYRCYLRYIILGSSARGEAVFDSDLDYALLLTEPFDRDEVRPYLYQFTQRMAKLGVPPCKGFVMGTNERWIGTLSEWRTRVDGYFGFPDWENVRFLFMILDSHVLASTNESPPSAEGCSASSADTWEDFRHAIQEKLRRSPYLCWEMAHLGIENTVTAPRKASGFLHFGEGAFNVKSGLLTPVLHSIRLLAVAHQVFEVTTHHRLHGLYQAGAIDRDMRRRIDACINYAWRVRIQQDVETPSTEAGSALKSTETGTIFLGRLTREGREELVEHAHTAKKLERMIHRQFRKPR